MTDHITLFVCETCDVFGTGNPYPRHNGHALTGLYGIDYESMSRCAAAHLVLAKATREGTTDDGYLTPRLQYARDHADWFSEEDSTYN